MNKIEALNQSLFLQINAGIDTPAWAVHTAIVVANDLIYLIPLMLLMFWFWGNNASRNQVIKACLVIVLALGVNQAIGLVWPHPRPFMIGLGHTWINHVADPSFPSDHLTVFVGVGLTALWAGAPWLAAAVLAAACAVAWSRVFLGVHYPLDMLGAVVVTGLTYALVSPLWRVIGDASTRTAEKLYRAIFSRLIAFRWIRH